MEMKSACFFAIVEGSGLAARVRGYLDNLCSSFASRTKTGFDRRLDRLRCLRSAPAAYIPENHTTLEKQTVHNLSSHELSQPELSVLSKGLNFAVAPSSIPHCDIITAVEDAITGCSTEDKAFVRKKAAALLRNASNPKANLSRTESEAIRLLRANEDIIVLPADKGNATAVLDKSDYKQKLQGLLDAGPYRKVTRDPGPTFRRELHRRLSKVVADGRLSRTRLLRLCPTHYQVPHLFGLPKIHKTGVPLRPIVSMRDSVLQSVSRCLADVMRPFSTSCDSYVQDSADLVRKLSDLDFPKGQFVSLDVVSLFTNVPIDETLEVFRELLLGDASLKERSCFTVDEIVDLTRLVLESCYFRHFDGLYLQTDGVAMGSSLGPVAANIFMSRFETLALREALRIGLSVPTFWVRFVDDVLLFWPHSEIDLTLFHRFLCEFRPSICFNIERESNGLLPFLDVLIDHSEDSLSFSVYRKPTHTDLYVHGESAHPRHVFLGVARGLETRARRVCSRPNLPGEKRHLRRVLRANGYDERTVSRGLSGSTGRKRDTTLRRCSLPYVPGISERLSGILRGVGVAAAMRPQRTLRSLLVRKRPDKASVLGSVYRLDCTDCSWCYVGETGRPVTERMKEHKRMVRDLDVDRSEVARHAAESGHALNFDSVSVLEREGFWRRRVIKEALWSQKLHSSNSVKHLLGSSWRF
jgi:hypothetical protein